MKPALKRSVNRVLTIVTLMTILISAQQALGEASIIGSWGTGITHTKESGTNRALIFIANAEHNAAISLTSVTYGDQAMTKVVDDVTGTSGFRNYTAAFILDEDGVAAATSDTFNPTWSVAIPSSVSYASVFLENAYQDTLVGASDSTATASGTDPIYTGPLTTEDGDMVILGVNCGNTGSYTLLNGFTEGTDQSVGASGHTGATGHKAATGVPETPGADFSGSVNRQVIVGFVVKGTAPDPNIASNPSPSNGATGVLTSTGLSWDGPTAYTATSYDVYFGTEPNAYDNPKHRVYTEGYNPPGELEYGTMYYWAVDSNDSGTTHPGNPWSFTTFKLSDRVEGNMILLNDNGGWCWYQDEKVVYDPTGGNLLTSTAACYVGFGGVGGERNNDMDTTTFNLATGKRTRRVAHDFGGDDHNMGAFWIRPDGRYLHIYCQHYNDPQVTYLRLANYPNDGSSWGSEYTYNWETISGLTDTISSSYTNVYYMSGEGTGMGRLYNIIRVFTRTPCISYSDDWGATWHYMGQLNSPAGGATYSNFYHKFTCNGVDRIDFIGVENHPRDNNNNVYHGYIKNGKGYDSYGNVVDSNLYDQNAPSVQAYTPIFIADVNLDANSYHTGWTNEMELDKDGYPVCMYQTRHGTEPWGNNSGAWGNTGAADHRYFYARFDGSTWTSTELCKMGGGLHLPEQDYLGMGCIHPNDANIVYVATQFDPRDDTEYEYREIFKGVTPDKGLTWNWTQITFNSTQNNTRPAIPAWDANNTAVIWTRGNWNQNNYEQYDLVVVGMVDQEDVALSRVTYTDADELNTTEADDSAFTPTGPSGSVGAADDQWHKYTGYGNGGSCYTAGDGGTEDAPAIKTTISGLADGTYDVFAYFWCDPQQDWGVRGGFEPSEPNMLCFSKQSSQYAASSQFYNHVETIGNGVILYRVYIGRKEVSGGAPVYVYIDDYDGSYNSNPPDHTTYDGVGVARVTSGCVPGDLDCSGEVDFIDFAILGQGWLGIYDIETLADLADYWLYGT